MVEIATFDVDKQFVYHINSKNRIRGTPEQFDIELQLSNTSLDEYDHISVLSCSIPKSYYAIEGGYNTFKLIEGNNPLTEQVIITIPEGNYNANQFTDELTSLLNTNSPTNLTYTMTLSIITGKYTWTAKTSIGGSPSFQPIFETSMNVYEKLGFDSNSQNQFVGDTLTSSNVIDLSQENDLFIRSSIISGAVNSNEDILFDVNASQLPPFSRIQIYNNNVYGFSKLLNNSSNIFSFRITDENGRTKKLNGVDWDITLLIYKASPIPSKTIDLMRLIGEMI